MAQREAGLQTLAVSEGRSHFCVQGCHLNREKKTLQVSASAARSFSLSRGLNLRCNHARTDMHDQRPCQRISCLQAPVHTAGGQSGSNASACLRRFSLCFALPGLVKHARAASRAVCWTLRDGRRSAVRIMKCVNCSFSCREAVRNWLCRSVLMRGGATGSSQRNVNVLFQINIKHVSCRRAADH